MALTGSSPVRVSKVRVRVDQAAVGEWRQVGVGEVQVEKGLELAVFPDAEVGQRFVPDGKDFATGSAGEAAGNAGLDDQVGAIPVNLSHKRPGGGEAADAGDEGGDAGLDGGRRGRGWMPIQQEVDSGLNFKRCGGGQ